MVCFVEGFGLVVFLKNNLYHRVSQSINDTYGAKASSEKENTNISQFLL